MIEERDVFLAKYGDEEAIEKIIQAYKPYIYIKNKTLFLKGADKDDLVQEGMIGLVKAIRSYDHTREACFNTFASLCIKRQILTAVKNHNSDKHKNLNTSLRWQNSTNTDESNDHFQPVSAIYNPEELCITNELFEDINEYLKENLSKLEKRVFEYIIQGYGYVEIGEILKRSPKTIDNTIQRIRKKANVYLKSYNKK